MEFLKTYLRSLIIIAGVVFSSSIFYACSDEPDNISDEKENVTDNGDADEGGSGDDNTTDGNILIVYFSRTGYNYPNQWLDIGHTARVAGFIAELTGGDSFELLPEIPYPDDYQQTVSIAREELDNNSRPKFKGEIANITEYDIIFVGGPVWHGAMPMIIRTFYESYDLSGKTIVPFATHAGSGLGDCERLARSYYPDGNILAGLAVQGTHSADSKSDVEAWLRRIGIME